VAPSGSPDAHRRRGLRQQLRQDRLHGAVRRQLPATVGFWPAVRPARQRQYEVHGARDDAARSCADDLVESSPGPDDRRSARPCGRSCRWTAASRLPQFSAVLANSAWRPRLEPARGETTTSTPEPPTRAEPSRGGDHRGLVGSSTRCWSTCATRARAPRIRATARCRVRRRHQHGYGIPLDSTATTTSTSGSASGADGDVQAAAQAARRRHSGRPGARRSCSSTVRPQPVRQRDHHRLRGGRQAAERVESASTTWRASGAQAGERRPEPGPLRDQLDGRDDGGVSVTRGVLRARSRGRPEDVGAISRILYLR